jgi:hypothetical protein
MVDAWTGYHHPVAVATRPATCAARRPSELRSSLVKPGGTPSTDVPLAWPTSTAAADQVGLSRRYAGIHYRSGDLANRVLGRQIGTLTFLRASAHLAGVAPPRP